ncbi:MAG: hypothetical protein HY786_01950 [Deltaproteobacteria bacterium]|nr:hypothetical protein [Deltaproteobacteria bacterium]
MLNSAEAIKPKYLIDEKGRKAAVVISFKDYNNLLESLEDLEDANDLLNAEKEATGFSPYEKFRQRWLKS